MVAIIEDPEKPRSLSTAVYRFLSRNEWKGSLESTGEEKLLEIICELKDAYEDDLGRQDEIPKNSDAATMYPDFSKLAIEKAEEFKEEGGFGRLLTVPSFALGLVMASRIRRHYTHAPWFNISKLSKMLEEHGAVRGATIISADELTGGQFVAEFWVESIEVLERLVNPEKPPLKTEAIERLREKLLEEPSDAAEIEAELAEMGTAFERRGNASDWDENLLAKIDECFVKNYYESGVLNHSLFFPDDPENLNRFTRYCTDVDRVLLENTKIAPPYARPYFAYAMIWRKHGYKFPIPLGTASVIEAVNTLATKYKEGLYEVSGTLHPDFVISPSSPILHSLPRIHRVSIHGTISHCTVSPLTCRRG
jgi:hypothetical protein